MRAILLLLCLFASSSWASVIPLNPPINIMNGAAGYITHGPVAIADAGTAVQMRAAVGVTSVSMPAVMTLGEGATAVALSVLRATPAIATATAIAYLAQIGIQKCLDGSWCKPQKSPNAGDTGFDGFLWSTSGLGANYNSPLAACQAAVSKWHPGYSVTGVSVQDPNDYYCSWRAPDNSTGTWGYFYRVQQCVPGYVLSGGKCGPDPTAPKVPTTDDDWNKGLSYPVPAAVATDLAAANAPIPVNITPAKDPATGKPTPVTVYLGDPYVDPVTGKRYRDVAVVTPNTDGKTATLTTAKQEVDANGNPVTDPATGGGKAPEKQDDPCTGHETRTGCMEQGDVPDGPDLKEQKISVAITPDGGWGSDTAACPADLTAMVHGLPVALSFKPVCDGADMFRPIIIACAWLGAALIVVGAGRKGEE